VHQHATYDMLGDMSSAISGSGEPLRTDYRQIEHAGVQSLPAQRTQSESEKLPKWFIITIDTEGDRACPFFGNRWGPLTGRYCSVLHVIPELRALWNRFSIKPVYLASVEVLSSAACVEILKEEQQAGAEVGTHLHIGDAFPCNVREEREYLERITGVYEQAFRSSPHSYRAGRYGMNDGTLATLGRLGYRVDTSVTPNVDWSPQGGPDYTTYPAKPYWVGDILEVPVTILGPRRWWPFKGWTRHRWLRPSVATASQLEAIVDNACDAGLPVLNMTFHAMELVPGASPYVRTFIGTHFYLLRLETVIAHIMARGFEPITLSRLHSLWAQHGVRTKRATVGG